MKSYIYKIYEYKKVLDGAFINFCKENNINIVYQRYDSRSVYCIVNTHIKNVEKLNQYLFNLEAEEKKHWFFKRFLI